MMIGDGQRSHRTHSPSQRAMAAMCPVLGACLVVAGCSSNGVHSRDDSADRAITLRSNSVGPVKFGTGKQRATAELDRLLGPASGHGINTGCGPAFTEVEWGELAVEFHHNVLSGYRDINRPRGDLELAPVLAVEPVSPAAKTAAGIILSDSVRRLRDAYSKLTVVGANRLEASNGLMFVDDSQQSPGPPQARIIEIRIGTCGDY